MQECDVLDLVAACKLLIELVADLIDDASSVDPEWCEQVLASARKAVAEAGA
jgi:hypothetical protein